MEEIQFPLRAPQDFWILRKDAFNNAETILEYEWDYEIQEYITVLIENKNKTAALQRRGLQLRTLNAGGLIHHLHMLVEIFSNSIDFGRNTKFQLEVQQTFVDYLTEECCLLVLAGYLRRHRFGAECFRDLLLQKKIFLPSVCVFYSTCENFLNLERKLELSPLEKRLNKHLEYLAIPLISYRKDINSFQEEVLPYFIKNLSKSSLHALQLFLKQLHDEGRWNALWYIFDRELFVKVVTKAYLAQSKIVLSEMTEERQAKQADFIFVCLLQDLINQKIKRWEDLSSICWKTHITEFHMSVFGHPPQENKEEKEF